MILFLAFFSSFLLSAALTPLIRLVTTRLKIVAKPRPDRWHKKPIALLGGVGIYMAFIIPYLTLYFLNRVGEGGLLILCSSCMWLLGTVDDFFQLKPYAKLIVQIVTALMLTAYGLVLPWTPWNSLNLIVTIFWLVGVTNALNLLDHIDGLAAGVAGIAALFMIYFFDNEHLVVMTTILSCFAGATFGFLIYNFHPASIFMGDSGSLFLGFLLGGAVLYHHDERSSSLISILAPPLLVLAIPIFDTSLVTILRKLNGRPISQGAKDHTSHRLVALGLSERDATLTLYTLAVVSGLVAVVASKVPASIGLALLPTFLIFFLFIAIYLGRAHVYSSLPSETGVFVDEPGAKISSKEKGLFQRYRNLALLPTFEDFSYKKRIFEVCNDFILVLLAFYGSFLLRFEGDLTEPYWFAFKRAMPIVASTQMLMFLFSGQYAGIWRYTGIRDVRRFLFSVWLACSTSTLVTFVVFGGLRHFSKAVFLLDFLLLFTGISSSRLSFRLMKDWLHASKSKVASPLGKRILIYGAGDAGELLLREIYNNSKLALFPVGFLDDNPKKHGLVIHGIKVFGSLADLDRLRDEMRIEELLVAIADGLSETRLHEICVKCNNLSIGVRKAKIALEEV